MELSVALATGCAILFAPGAWLARMFGWNPEFHREEKPALWLVASLALYAPPAILAIAIPVPLSAVVAGLAILAVAAAAAATLLGIRRVTTGGRRATAEDGGAIPKSLILCALVAASCLAMAAYSFTRGGSIDRWWYLAFVQTWLANGSFSPADPFLGGGLSMARFAGNAWLTALTVWAKLSRLPPYFLYESAAPLLLAPVALSAAAMSTRVLLGSRKLGIVAVILSATYWMSGGIFPAMARLPEDKLLAILVGTPVLWAAVVRFIDRSKESPIPRVSGSASGRGLALIVSAALALACIHPLIFGLSLVLLVPAVIGARLRVAVVVLGILATISLLPLSLGRSALSQVGAQSTHSGSANPVLRIHESRGHVHEVDASLHVPPALLIHPLTVAALLTAFTLALVTPRTRVLLSIPTATALLLCFVPSLATAVGKIIGPWMVYRLVWVIPLTPLLALLADALAEKTRLGLALPVALAIAIATPSIATSLDRRSAETRTRLATPVRGELSHLVAKLSALPLGSLVAAAPELSERIPGLSGRRVLAASDRATSVFSDSDAEAHRRMRDRAAVLAGLWRKDPAAAVPTHVVFEPGGHAARYCGRELYRSDSYVLCEMNDQGPIAGIKLHQDESAAIGGAKISITPAGFVGDAGDVRCDPDPRMGAALVVFEKPGPWSARAPSAACRFGTAAAEQTTGGRQFRPRALAVEFAIGRAREEMTITATAERDGVQRWSLRTRREIRNGEVLRFALPTGEVDGIVVELIPSFLPFVKVRELSLEIEPAAPSPP